jgi:hypothetical protein
MMFCMHSEMNRLLMENKALKEEKPENNNDSNLLKAAL